MSNSYSPPRGFVSVFVCGRCQARREVASDDTAPTCGELSTDMTRFPDGGWTRIETWIPHGVMNVSHSLGANPFEDILAANE